MKIRKKIEYVAKDGKSFKSEKECIDYEGELIEEENRIKE